MLKKSAYKRIIIATLALIILGLLYFFPENNDKEIKESLSYIDVETTPIYLIDNNEYVARTNILKTEKDSIKLAKEILESLIIGSKKNDYIPEGFKAIIPANTKILDISLENKLLKVNFSKELLNISDKNAEKMLEAIIYSLTEIEEIESIMIFIDGEKLTKLPNNNNLLPNVLDRSFGINKIYDLTSFKNVNSITSYYLSKHNDNYYYVPVTKVSNNNKEKIEVIIEELKTAPINQTNLISFLATNVELTEYEILEDSISLSFNNYVFDNFSEKSILEEVKYSIALSIRDSYDIKNISFNVDGVQVAAVN
ncbi:MAG: GerMN domain-containing protein [Bacilli bacterium]|nr:GerMN domain-containing protein [Bacilli bacterium]